MRFISRKCGTHLATSLLRLTMILSRELWLILLALWLLLSIVVTLKKPQTDGIWSITPGCFGKQMELIKCGLSLHTSVSWRQSIPIDRWVSLPNTCYINVTCKTNQYSTKINKLDADIPFVYGIANYKIFNVTSELWVKTTSTWSPDTAKKRRDRPRRDGETTSRKQMTSGLL